MDKTIQQTLSKICQLLDDGQIRHALVGGLAASIRGKTRATEDIDLVLDCDVEAALSFLNSLDSDSFGPFFPEVEAVVRQCYILPLEDIQSKVKLDLAIGVSGFEKLIVERSTRVKFSDMFIQVATKEDLLLMKLLAGRPQDDQDIRGILIANKSDIDWTWCLNIAEQLQQALDIDLIDKVKKLKLKFEAT